MIELPAADCADEVKGSATNSSGRLVCVYNSCVHTGADSDECGRANAERYQLIIVHCFGESGLSIARRFWEE